MESVLGKRVRKRFSVPAGRLLQMCSPLRIQLMPIHGFFDQTLAFLIRLGFVGAVCILD